MRLCAWTNRPSKVWPNWKYCKCIFCYCLLFFNRLLTTRTITSISTEIFCVWRIEIMWGGLMKAEKIHNEFNSTLIEFVSHFPSYVEPFTNIGASELAGTFICLDFFPRHLLESRLFDQWDQPSGKQRNEIMDLKCVCIFQILSSNWIGRIDC